MITTRRSFVKGLSFALGSLPLPGVVKEVVSKLAPEEQTLEDAEDILRGLIARVVNGPIDLREAQLIDSFLARMKPTKEQIDLVTDYSKWSTQRDEAKSPYVCRFITGFTKGSRINPGGDGFNQFTPWFRENFKTIADKTKIIHKLVKVFNPNAEIA